jgi:hypothetical protein
VSEDRIHDETSDRRDLLISKMIDGEAGEADWSAFRALAEAEPAVWGELARTQRHHEALSLLVDEVSSIADGVEIPRGELLTPAERFDRRMGAVRAWGGWAAAAAVVLVWFTGLPAPTGQSAPSRAGLPSWVDPSEQTPEWALARYLDSGQRTGRVVGEVPERVVLDTRPAPGGVEVLYLRQFVEREFVGQDRVYRLGRDEFGQRTLLPQSTPAPARVSY